SAAGISLDLDGQPRLLAGQVDAGPYEAGAATATALVITAQPSDPSYQISSASNIFAVTATGDALGYQWQLAAPNAPFVTLTDGTNFSGTTSSTLTVLASLPALNGSLVRCIVTSTEGCTAIS